MCKLKTALWNIVDRAIAGLEDDTVPFAYALVTFIAAITLRPCLEIFSDNAHITLTSYLHIAIYYVPLSLLFIIIFHLVTKVPVSKVARVVLPAFVVVDVAPIVDLLVSGGEGINISYLVPGSHDNLLHLFFTFFGEYQGSGISIGMKVEIAMALLGCFLYVQAKTSNILKALFTTVVIYGVIFSFIMLPFWINWSLSMLGLRPRQSDFIAIQYHALATFVTGCVLAYFGNRRYFILFLKDMRWLRMAHFELMYILGRSLSHKGPGPNLIVEVLDSAFMFIAIFLAFFFSIVTNNLADVRIDAISSPKRPLMAPGVDTHTYRKVAWPVLFAALFFAGMNGFLPFLGIAIFIGNYFIYSMPPLRFKRVPILSKFVISVNSLTLVYLGLLSTETGVHYMPEIVITFFLISFTLAANFIDIKDYDGDKAARIKTLPVLVGLRASKILIGLFWLIAYISIYPMLKGTVLIVGAVILGLIQFGLINRKRYTEKPVFIVYLISIVGFIVYLRLLPPVSL